MKLKTILLALCTLAPMLVFAEQVRIPIGQQSDLIGVSKPRHGITKSEVEAEFGSPSSRRGPVGEPPIYFWEYNDFTVYFESDRVIHSVSKIKSNKAAR